MFSLKRCKAPECGAYTFSGGDWCFHHSPDRSRLKMETVRKLEEGGSLSDISIVAADFRGVTVKPGTKIVGVNFSFCIFDSCVFSNAAIYSVFFDYSVFINCRFISSDIRYAVFAGSSFISCSISDSTVIHSNFMGTEAEDCDFSGNDFYYSNFSLSRLVSTSMEDCNLKRTSFRSSITKNVSFRYSNPEEAYLRQGE